MHHFVGADSSCISWGQAQYGELGYGPLGQKYAFIPLALHITQLLFSLIYLPLSIVYSFILGPQQYPRR